MRNFSFVSNKETTFVSYSINYGEYVQDVKVEGVLLALAAAFETDRNAVSKSYGFIAAGGSDYCDVVDTIDDRHVVCPSEWRVLCDLNTFSLDVERLRADKYQTGQTTVFSYVNLNTGHTVTWIHVVE